MTKRKHSVLTDLPFKEKEILEKYILLFVPKFLYTDKDFKVLSVQKESFDNGVSRTVIKYEKKDVDRPGKFLKLTHYDDWVIPDDVLEQFPVVALPKFKHEFH